jgi:hypothetical protein
MTVDAAPAAPAPVEVSRIDARWQAEAQGKSAYVSAYVKNTGDRSIVLLQLTITFFDASGKIVDQEPCEMVNSALVHAQDKGRLEPNQGRFFTFTAKKCPAVWHEGKVAIDVKSIDFAG